MKPVLQYLVATLCNPATRRALNIGDGVAGSVRMRFDALTLRETPTLRQMHDWLYQENTAYATKRLLEERKPLDPALLKSY